MMRLHVYLIQAACLLPSAAAQAQQSVNQELDTCIKQELRSSSLIGAALGALSGFSFSMQGSERDRDRGGRQVSIGLGGGGALGLASGYYNAVGSCYKSNPTWIPESRLERTKGYEQALQYALWDNAYRPGDGFYVRVTRIDMAEFVKPGQELEIRSHFIVLTPMGSEAEVRIERRLFAIAGGEEQQLSFTGHASEARTIAAGGGFDLARLPIPAQLPAGVAYRIEFSLSVAGAPVSTLSATTSVRP